MLAPPVLPGVAASGGRRAGLAEVPRESANETGPHVTRRLRIPPSAGPAASRGDIDHTPALRARCVFDTSTVVGEYVGRA